MEIPAIMTASLLIKWEPMTRLVTRLFKMEGAIERLNFLTRLIEKSHYNLSSTQVKALSL